MTFFAGQAVLTYELLKVVGDPNTGIHATLDTAPAGTFWLDAGTGTLWRKKTTSPTSWLSVVDVISGAFNTVEIKTVAETGSNVEVNKAYVVVAAPDDVLLNLPDSDVDGVVAGQSTTFLLQAPSGRLLIQTQGTDKVSGMGLDSGTLIALSGDGVLVQCVFSGSALGDPTWLLFPYGEHAETVKSEKAAAHYAASTPLAAYTPSGTYPNEILTGNANGSLIVDGVDLETMGAVGERVLVGGEVGAAKQYHGVYEIRDTGSDSTAFVLRRWTGWSLDGQVAEGGTVSVLSGDTNAGVLFSAAPTTVGAEFSWARVCTVNATAGPLTLWLDDSQPDDGGDGLTAGTAKKTWDAILTLIPAHVNHPIEIFVEPHTGAGYPPFSMPPKILGADIHIRSNSFTVLESGSVSGATTAFRLQRAAGANEIDDPLVVSKTVRITAGTGSGQYRTVLNTDVDGFVVGRAFSPVPDATSSWELIETDLEMEVTDEDVSMFVGVGPRTGQDLSGGRIPMVIYTGIRVKYGGGLVNPTLHWNSGTFLFHGLELDPTGSHVAMTLEVTGGALLAGRDDLSNAQKVFELGVTATNVDWAGWGLGELNKGSKLFTDVNESSLRGMFCVNSVFTRPGSGPHVLAGSRLYGASAGTVSTSHAAGCIVSFVGAFGATQSFVSSSGSRHVCRSLGKAGSTTLSTTTQLAASGTGDLVSTFQGGGAVIPSAATGTSVGGYAVNAGPNCPIFLQGLPSLVGSAFPGADYIVHPTDPGMQQTAAYFAASGDYLAHGSGALIVRTS